MKRKLLAMLLAGVMVVAAACGGTTGGQENAAVSGDETNEESADETGDAEKSDAKSLEERLEIEKPWINSNILGTVTDDYAPSEQEDYYVAANHDWLVDAELPAGYSSTGAAVELMLERDEQIQGLMTDDSLTGHDAELIQNLYELWLDWDSRNAFDVSEITKHTDIVKDISTVDELSDYYKSEECLDYGNSIAGFTIGTDNKDSEAYNVELTGTGLSLGDPAEYEEMTENGEAIKKYGDGIASYMLQKIGYSEAEATRLMEEAFDFETKIAKYMMTTEEQYDPSAIEKMHNPITMDELREKSKAYPYADILEAWGAGSSKLMNLGEPEWLEGLNELYTEENLESIKAYMIRNMASGYIRFIDEDSYREYQRLDRERSGITESMSDEKTATTFVKQNLSVPMEKLYVSRYVADETKEEVTEIIEKSIEVYRDMLSSEDWLSDETRKEAVEKLDALTPYVAYPDKWSDYSGLSIGTAEDGETLLSAYEKIDDFLWEKDLAKINTRVDRANWAGDGDIDVTEVNAYYDPTANGIYIIAGILGGNFYDADMSYEEKLGGIGAVVGHEISHAFDTNGAQYDKDGNVNDWWGEEDYKAFQDRADKLIAYLSDMVVVDTGEKYNGSLVQTETIADIAGLKAMLAIAGEQDDFDYDAFFRSYARTWKDEETREAMLGRVNSDPHAMDYLRVNVIVQQFDEFNDTYGVKEDDNMYLAPEDRVLVW
ncbi:MAG: M13 family metallopeptidase [Lachnospiraceae bacterium]|nr:M13 family metallopeptidase [Lachnospiraceae bacterium]